METDNLESLSKRIVHDHMRTYQVEESKEGPESNVVNILGTSKLAFRKRLEK